MNFIKLLECIDCMNLIFEFGKHHDLNVWSQTCKSVQKTLSCCVPEFYVVEKSKTLSQNMIQFVLKEI